MKLYQDTKFLVVDDEQNFRDENVKKLVELGFELEAIETAKNGEEALEYAKNDQKKYEFFIVDLVMPKMNGLQLIEQLNKLEKYKSTPKLVVSGSFDRSLVKKVAQVGANSFVVKPVDLETFAKKITSCANGLHT